MKIVNGRNPFAMTKNLALNGECQGNVNINGVYADLNNAPINEIAYDPATWAEWTKNGVDSADFTGLVLNSVDGMLRMNTNFEASTQYGLLYEVIENATTSTYYTQLGSNHAGTGFKQNVGFQKVMTTTPAIIGENRFRIGRNAQIAGYIKFRNVRLFKLPVGSKIEWDFTNLEAVELNMLYPF